MSAYVVVRGDSWESISRKKYGTESEAGRIERANPGVSEPLSEGSIIFVPPSERPEPPVSKSPPINENSTQDEKTAADEMSVFIDGKRFLYQTTLSISRVIDQISSMSFSTSSDVKNTEFSDAFMPFSFSRIDVRIGGGLIFKGIMVNPVPSTDANSSTISVSCYGLPGVLQDCNASAADFPIEYTSLTVTEIAKSLCEPFGISVVAVDDVGATFDTVALDAQTKVFAFISGLAKQRNLILTDTPKGELLITRASDPGNPVSALAEDEAPLMSVSASFDPQNYYSHVTGLRPALIGSDGEQYTVKNPRLDGILRPFIFNADDTEDGNLQQAVENKAGLMFASAVSYSVNVATWRDSKGELWIPDTTLSLTGPRTNIPNAYEFLIKSVTLDADSSSRVATLGLVVPGSFSGKLPESLPWDG